MKFLNIPQDFVSWFFSSGIKILLILFFAWLGTRFGQIFISKLIKILAKESSKIKGIIDGKVLSQREATLRGVFNSLLKLSVWTIAILTVLPEFGINLGPLLASLGLAGFALGFGARNLIQDYLSGLFILIEDQYRVGEEIKISGIQGKVIEFNLRRTVLEDSEGKIHFIPNGQIKQVTNFSRKAK